MRDINYEAIGCMRELEIIGIEFGNVREFVVNTRAKRRWGQCRRLPDGTYSININACLLNEDVPIDSLKNTIIHELLHTCKGCMNHGENWKRLADKVNRYYGYNIKRCSSSDEKGIDEEEKHTSAKYVFKCKKCGKYIYKYRASKFTKYYTFYHHICGGDFEKVS